MNKLFYKVTLLFFSLLPCLSLAQGFILDSSGCKIYNPQPKENETVEWSGKCVNGYADGSGKLEWFINMELIEVYEGAMSEGWASGEGTLISKDGYRYTGSWKKSTQSGFGIAETLDGYRYKGNWKNGKQHGWGTLIQPNGESISGEWVEGELVNTGGKSI